MLRTPCNPGLIGFDRRYRAGLDPLRLTINPDGAVGRSDFLKESKSSAEETR